MRATSAEAQRAIAEAALITFGNRGYGLATLEEIGARVGLTRGAVLHHFKSKAGLLTAVVDPCRQALAQLLTTAALTDPPTFQQRRELLAKFAEFLMGHHASLALLVNDVSARIQLGLDDEWPMPPERLVTLLVGSDASYLSQVRAAAAIGAMLQPASWAWVNLDDAKTRAELIEAAIAIFPGSRSAATHHELKTSATSLTPSAPAQARVAAP